MGWGWGGGCREGWGDGEGRRGYGKRMHSKPAVLHALRSSTSHPQEMGN